MSDELDVQVETEVKTPPERDWETEAKAMGWNPDHEGPEKLDAKEFVQRKPLYDEMRKMRKKSRELEDALLAQQKNFDAIVERERQATIEKLDNLRKQALKENDVETALEITEKIATEKQKPVQKTQARPPQEYEDFIERNTWYNDDKAMKRYADAYGVEYRREHPNATAAELFEAVERETKEAFKHKYTNPNREKPLSVESGDNTNPTPTREVKVPQEHRTVANTMWRKGYFGDPSKVSFKEALTKYVTDYRERFGEFE